MNDNRPLHACNADAEAAEWFVRLQRQDGPEAQAAFQTWLHEDPANAAAWDKIGGAWSRLGELAEAPEIRAARADLQRELRRGQKVRRQRMAAAAAVLLAVIGGGALSYQSWRAAGPVAGQAGPTVYRTPVGGRLAVDLPDGSQVVLNTDTEVRAGDWSKARAITLVRGEAFFQVAKDPQRPFTVTADGRTVTALGTAFNVRLDSDRWSVDLLEGRVRVRSGGAAAELSPGERLVQEGPQSWRILRRDVAEMSAWRDGRLVFHDQPLGEIADEMNRYSEAKLQIADAGLAQAKLSGRFRAGDVEGFVAMLEAYGLATPVREADRTITLRPVGR